jgi:hypothetical protein
MSLLDEHRNRDPRRGAGIATGPAPHAAPARVPTPHVPTQRRLHEPVPAAAAQVEHSPGFCERCDRPTRVRLGAGPGDLAALCRDCRAAESADRAAARGSHRITDR